MGSFKILESLGNDLKREHRRKLRKYVKFDETEEDLFLHVKHDDDDSWLTFTPTEAKEELNKKNYKKVTKSNIHRTPSKADDERETRGRRLGALAKEAPGGVGEQASGGVDMADVEDMEEEEDGTGTNNTTKWIPPARD